MIPVTWDLLHPGVAEQLQLLGAILDADATVPEFLNLPFKMSDESYRIEAKYLALGHVKLHCEGIKFDFDFPIDLHLWNSHDYEQDVYFAFGDYCNADIACIYVKSIDQLNTGNPIIRIIDHELDDNPPKEEMTLADFLKMHLEID